MKKTYDIIIEPHQLLMGDATDTILFKVFFEAIKEANKLGTDGYKIVNFQLVDLGQHQARFHRQFIFEFEELTPEPEKDVSPMRSNYLSSQSEVK
jgi:hypothetical protein